MKLEEYVDGEVKCKTLYEIAMSFIYIRKFDTARYILSYLVELGHKMGDSAFKAKAMSQISYAHYRSGQINDAYELIIKAQKLAEKYSDSHYIAINRFRHGVFAKKLSKYEEAITQYNKALEIYEAKGNEKMKARLLGNIGNLFFNLDHLDKAIQYHNEAIAVHKILKDSVQIAGSLNDLGNSYYKKGITDMALNYYFNAAEINRRIGNDIWLAYNTQNISTIYSDLNRYEEALKYAREALKFKKNGNDPQSLLTSYATIGDIYYLKGNYQSALEYLDTALNLSSELGVKNDLITIIKNKAKTYAAMGKYKEAYEMRLEYAAEKDSVFNEKKINAINDIHEKYETARKEQQIQELTHQKEIESKEKQVQRIIFASVLFGFILILLFVLQKRKKDRQLLRQKELVHKKEKALAEAELEKSKLKEEELQQSNNHKTKQLSTHALHMVQKNTILQEIQDDLKKIAKRSNDEDKPQYKRINLSIKQSLRADNDWDVFKMYFEDINKNFYNYLKKVNENLSIYDFRLCALIKLNFNSKEMASVLNIAPNSIKSARYRLKKRLKLDEEVDLEEFIRKID